MTSSSQYKPSRIIGKNIDSNIANQEIDISEDILFLPGGDLLSILLKDRTTDKNIIWATDNYSKYGEGYQFSDEITPERITGDMNLIIQPRIAKDKATAGNRTKEKAEVFTPSWICEKMNNCIDNSWFGVDDKNNAGNVFDQMKIDFDELFGSDDKNTKTWQDYVLEDRLEITCGEAPYLVSRYDATTGEVIPIEKRYGILDRKIRIVSENVNNENEWIEWVVKAYQHTYGYEWQGDSILLARENMLATALDHYHNKFGNVDTLSNKVLKEIATIISWNIWQMDGLKFVIPCSCERYNKDVNNGSDAVVTIDTGEDDKKYFQDTLFDLDDYLVPLDKTEDNNISNNDNNNNNNSKETVEIECIGCKKNKRLEHIGIYAKIMDWTENKEVRFVDLFNQ